MPRPSPSAQRLGPLARAWMPRVATLTDQVLSSVSNVLAVVLVARVLSAYDFGRFALAYAFLTLILNLSRSYFGTRVSLAPDPASARQLTSDLMAALGILAPAVAVGVFVASALATGGRSLDILLIVALATPIVCIQDIIRFGAVAAGKPYAPLVSDGVWVLVMAVPLVSGMDLSSTAAMGLWGSAAVLALVVAAVMIRARPRPRAGLAELRKREPVGGAVLVGALVVSVSTLWVLLVVSRAIDPAAAGSLRGASTAMGPVNVLIAFSWLGLTPALVRRGRSQDLSFCALTALVMALLTAAWGALLLLLPHRFGVAAFGDSWDGIREVLPWTLVEYVCLVVAAAALLGLKVRRQAGDLMMQRIAAATVMSVGGTVVALQTQRTTAVAATLAVAALVSASVGWWHLVRGGPIRAPYGADLEAGVPRAETLPAVGL